MDVGAQSASPNSLTSQIRYALAQLRARNGHHTFEDICREFSRIRISRNIVPATGPVSSGGDQGRDFETFRSFVHDAVDHGFSSVEPMGRLAFTCTLQQNRLKEKIQADVSAVMQGGPVSAVYAFCEANFPVARRHQLQQWAINTHQVELEIIDGMGLAEGLAKPDTLWIAVSYLHLPASLDQPPERMVVGKSEANDDDSQARVAYQINGHVLLPAGVDGLFFPITSNEEEGRIDFKFDAGVLEYLLGELVSHGATGIATDSASYLAEGRAELPRALRRLTHVFDPKGQQLEELNLAFRPIATDLGLEPEHVDVINDPIAGPQRHVLDLPAEQRRPWSDLLLAHSATYHLLIGINTQAQIDVPLREFSASVRRLLRAAKSPTSTATLGFLAALAESYKPCRVGAVTPAVSTLNEPWINTFEEYLRDVAYQEYSTLRSELGYLTRVEKAIERSWGAARRLVERIEPKRKLQLTERTVAVNTGMPPHPPSIFSDHFRRTRYLPPVIKTTSPLAHATLRWLSQNDTYNGTLNFGFEHFEWLPSSRVPSLVTGTFRIDYDWFLGLFTTTSPIDITERRWQQSFEHYFAVNLEIPYLCSKHDVEIGYDDVNVAWGTDIINIAITCCCERGAHKAFELMCVFRSDKRAEYATGIS